MISYLRNIKNLTNLNKRPFTINLIKKSQIKQFKLLHYDIRRFAKRNTKDKKNDSEMFQG